MKKLSFAIVVSLVSLISFNASAFNLDDLVKTDENGRVEISGDSIGKDLEKKLEEKINKEIEKVSKDIDGKVNELKAKADSEMAKVTKIIDEAQKEFDLIKRMKAKVRSYIMMAYIAVGALGVLIIVLILLLIKLWLKVSKIGKIGYAFKVIKNIDKRITSVEAKLAKLSK